MPIYEYQCSSCGRTIEILQRVSDPPLATCSECGGEVKKLIPAPAFHFKGSGWYVTDYADKSGKESGGDEAQSKEKDSAKDSSEKTESKASKDSASPDKKSEKATTTTPAAS